MRTILIGWALACQFFTILPIHKTLPMNRRTVTTMFAMLPLIGLVMGAILYGMISSLQLWTPLSPLFIAVIVVVMGIVMTGGLHMDGWLDMSDAFFSYGDRQKRQQVLDDPRTGAFGVISFVSLFAVKVVTIYELLHFSLLAIAVIAIPFYSRIAILLYFVSTAPSKESGLGAYFKRETSKRMLMITAVSYLITATLLAVFLAEWSLFVMMLVLVVAVLLYRNWSRKHFGGMSGDLMGALCEGMEVLLWLSLLSFI